LHLGHEMASKLKYYWPVLLLAGLKFVAYFVYGPISSYDSKEYFLAANILLENTEWMYDAGLDKAAISHTIFRPLGYPFLIAFLQWILGTHVEHFIVLLQLVVSIAAFKKLYDLLGELYGETLFPALIIILLSLTTSWLFDIYVLTDSFMASFYIYLFSALGSSLLRKELPSMGHSLLLGIMMACMVYLRGNGHVFCLTLVPLILSLFYFSTGRKIQRGMIFALIILPAAISYEGYRQWNYMRTGEAILTTGGQTVMFQPLFTLASRGVPVFESDSVVDRTVKEVKRNDYSINDVLALNEALFEQEQWSALEIQKVAYAKYIDTWRLFPGEMSQLALSKFESQKQRLLLNPLSLADILYSEQMGKHYFPGVGKFLRALPSFPPLGFVLFGIAFLVSKLQNYESAEVSRRMQG
jgi:hypothetical protein